MKRLLIATGNAHKTSEIRAMLGSGWQVEDLSEHPRLPQPEETGASFSENAQIKALAASSALTEVLVLADDSGLEVDALGGSPGVRSARYAGDGSTDKDNRDLLKRELRKVIALGGGEPFTGRFRCCMALAKGGALLSGFDGFVEGRLLMEEEGAGGFGYDALFVPEGHDASFGVLSAEVKNSLSHRSRALAKVRDWLGAHDVD